MAHPTRFTWSISSAGVSWTRNPGIDSNLSSVPPVWPSPRPESLATRTPQLAARGTSTSEVLSPTPPVLCLSTVRPRIPRRSRVSPLSTMTLVNAAVSAALMPRK